MEKLEGIVAVVGNYGSGKTEVAINFAVDRKRAGIDVRIADLDLVNPYFRMREARGPLSDLGIDVVLPPEELLQADLPILSPAVAGMLRQRGRLTVLDVGGQDFGARVLATLADPLRDKHVNMLLVVNPFRPFTDTVAGCLKIRDKIEKASKIAVTGIIGNANLIDETSLEDVYKGYDFVRALSKESALPLMFITVAAELLPAIDSKRFDCPILVIKRQLVPPWKKPVRFKQRG
ncbi:MAG: cobalamin biosynthesis protein CbiA [Candidatus Desulfatibia sp.]|uniref:cobalamin biosynthesis protein CbiA n=1 Tax=Candidatus Desulfatibia sp. TaxID=3101189 RepID=UPI002F2EF902